ncbi:MAG: glycosyltransferase family 4 protein [Geodermatophilaceae bacterium]|nr:glycosyltransferase family 4 protein [Geodermatophilaceae bacterium]
MRRTGRSHTGVLIIVQNLPVPLDRRVWLECLALRSAGYAVSVICPKGPEDPSYEELEGVHIYKYKPAPPSDGPLTYLWEFLYSWMRTAALSLRVWRRHGFGVIQACNPPDTYWSLAQLWRLRSVRFVYDQHDLNPEVFRSRFGEPRGLFSRLQFAVLSWLERSTFRTSDQVISTNESYRQVAIERGGCDPDRVTVVRSGPNTSQMRPLHPLPDLREERRHLLVYLGIMGPQDGVDIALHALSHLVHERGRTDVHLALLGFGDCYDDLVALSAQLGLDDHVTFTGRADWGMVASYLSTASIGLSPDPASPLNNVSTMNKTMEYMSLGVPVVAFDLHETRVSAGDTANYVDPASGARGLSAAIEELLGDEQRRIDMGVAGRIRAQTHLDWRPQAEKYVAVFDRVTGRVRPAVVRDGERRVSDEGPGLSPWGFPYVDLRWPGALAEALHERVGESAPERLAG